jgi:hypothetical protein
MQQVLADRVGRALEPVRSLQRLFRGKDPYERAREEIEPVCGIYMVIERFGIELGKHVDALYLGVQAVAYRDVDKAVFSPYRNGWF